MISKLQRLVLMSYAEGDHCVRAAAGRYKVVTPSVFNLGVLLLVLTLLRGHVCPVQVDRGPYQCLAVPAFVTGLEKFFR